MIRRQHTVSDFFENGGEMRGILDSAFKNTYTDRISWHYFCDPRMYAYLRTSPKDVFSKELFSGFMRRLRQWCTENLGLAPMGAPYLHLMINGCRLGLHSDFHNGTWGYVYSLTRWDSRKFVGGETLLLRDGVPSYKKHHVHGDALYELIPAIFNQLLVFDDRIVHATPTVEGSMDPAEGRIAMVGHIRATAPIVSGGIAGDQVRRVVLDTLPHLRERIRIYKDVQGTITSRLEIAKTGAVDRVITLTDNLVTPVAGYNSSDAVSSVKTVVYQTLAGLRFPPATGPSSVTVPLLIPLPDLRPIEIVFQHGKSPAEVCDWARSYFIDGGMVQLQGAWDSETYILTEPVAGRIHFGATEIVISVDPPMWVPSQREQFQRDLFEWVKSSAGGFA